MSAYPDENLCDILQKACLSKYAALALDLVSHMLYLVWCVKLAVCVQCNSIIVSTALKWFHINQLVLVRQVSE